MTIESLETKRTITAGNEYEVLKETQELYYIIDDKGLKAKYCKTKFKVLENINERPQSLADLAAFIFKKQNSGSVDNLTKKKNVFKVEDKVYNHKHGWMVVSGVYLDSCTCVDVNGTYLRFSMEYLSFTEYKLTGFSQERPIELPEVGEVCLFSVDECNWEISEFISYDKTQNYCFTAKSGDYCAMKRVKFL